MSQPAHYDRNAGNQMTAEGAQLRGEPDRAVAVIKAVIVGVVAGLLLLRLFS